LDSIISSIFLSLIISVIFFLLLIQLFSECTRAAVVKIDHFDGSSTATIDLTVRGGEWIHLGTFRFDSSHARVTVFSGKGEEGKVTVNAVMWLLDVELAPGTLLKAQSRKLFSEVESEGVWFESTDGSSVFLHNANQFQDKNVIRFTPHFVADTSYRVMLKWPRVSSRLASNVPIVVRNLMGAQVRFFH
jgi:hypothetical protein